MTSKRPHLVINHLHRKKLDANRDIGEAALGNAIAEEAFNEFHQCINEAKETIKADDCVDGTGLFLDIHGHGHPNNWAELGKLSAEVLPSQYECTYCNIYVQTGKYCPGVEIRIETSKGFTYICFN